ncbi:hypothetical protein AWB95_17740 [Mycobacterium celatum]|uniref:Uncharacterized protein n=3 Tax=Mycobacterium celatum TaxID=28045 RepID=A0A1X1RM90_MYCCE|nr:hypothetical protein AWB95_17740 [Mycobacterium celatum]
MLRLLEKKRQETHTKLGHRPMGVAACEVLDELIRRVRATAQSTAENAPLTLSDLRQFPDIIKAVTSVLGTMNTMFEVMVEGGEAVEDRRQPLLRFVARLQSEHYHVANDFTITAITDWLALHNSDDPDIQVQLEADNIARAEQAAVYEDRIKRMAAEIERIEQGYAQRVRDLIKPTLETRYR